MASKERGPFVASLAIIPLIALFSIASASPRKGGGVIIGLTGGVETLNPLLAENDGERQVFQAIFSCLYRAAGENGHVPDLLTGMPTRKGLTYHYELRKGVRFTDGHELDAADVKFTWECHMNPSIPVPDRSGWDEIESFTIPAVTFKGKDGKTHRTYDKYHFSVTLKRLSVRYPGLWADLPILPRHILEKEIAGNKARNAPHQLDKDGGFSRRPVGSGPFMLKEWKGEDYLRVVRNPSYYHAGRPYLDEISWRILPDAEALFDRFLAGEIDVCANIGIERCGEAAKTPGIKLIMSPAYIYNHIQLNLNDPGDLVRPHPILGDARVRRALDCAFPREAIVENLLGNTGYPAYANLSPASWAYNEAVAKPRYDPEKAGRLLDEAAWVIGGDGYRYKDGRKLQLTLYTSAGNGFREEVARICRDEWRKIGVELVLRYVDLATLVQEIMMARRFDCLLIAWAADPDPDSKSLWHSSQIPVAGAGGQNYTGYRNEEMDRLMEDGLATDDPVRRKAIYHRMQEILAEEVPYIFVNFYANLDGVRDGLEGFVSNPASTYMWNCYDWHWGT